MSDMHIVENGNHDAPALLLLSDAAAPTAIWDPVVPVIAAMHRVIRVDLLGYGSAASRTGRYEVLTWARQIASALDRLGVSRVTAIGLSSGCMLATALAELRPEVVAALVLIRAWPARWIPGGRLVITDLLWTRRYANHLRQMGMHNVQQRPLGWRFWYAPFLGGDQVTATKPPGH